MKIINFIGGPGVGKSTAALGTVYEMKRRYIRAEYCHEYAKDLTFEHRFNVLQDSLYVFAKQNRILTRLLNQGIDFAITDSALPLNLLYNPEHYFPSFKGLVKEVFDSYDNVNFLITRKYAYDPVGRNQTEEEAKALDVECKKLFKELGISYIELEAGDHVPMEVLKMVIKNV